MIIPKKRLILGGIAACFISAAGLIAITQHKTPKSSQIHAVSGTPIKVVLFDVHGVLLNNSYMHILKQIGFIPLLKYSILDGKNPLKLKNKILEVIHHIACQEGRTKNTGNYTTYDDAVIPLCMEHWQMGIVSSEQMKSIILETIDEFHRNRLFSTREKNLVTKITQIIFDPVQQIRIKKRNNDIIKIVEEIKEQKNELHQQKYKLVILSNMEKELVPLLKEQFSDITELFDEHHFSGEIQKLKPYDDIYAYVEQHHNIKASECYFIDDLAENVEAAKQRGWKTFHLHKKASSTQLRNELIKSGILPA